MGEGDDQRQNFFEIVGDPLGSPEAGCWVRVVVYAGGLVRVGVYTDGRVYGWSACMWVVGCGWSGAGGQVRLVVYAGGRVCGWPVWRMVAYADGRVCRSWSRMRMVACAGSRMWVVGVDVHLDPGPLRERSPSKHKSVTPYIEVRQSNSQKME